MTKMLFIADFFADQVPGGGELNNQVFIEKVSSLGHKVVKARSHQVSKAQINQANFIVVANFINLPDEIKDYLSTKKYIIYEHDHKYLRSRNPAQHENYIAPQELIINYSFYEKAVSVFCQSDFHAKIVQDNLKLNNIKSLGGNLWSDQHLEVIQDMAKTQKRPYCAIMQSSTPHKNTKEAIMYCKSRDLPYRLIPPASPTDFLMDLGQYDTLVFLPKTPETLSRVVVEARMMGMKTKTTSNIGAVHEQWFDKKGTDLINYIKGKQDDIIEIILGAFHE